MLVEGTSLNRQPPLGLAGRINARLSYRKPARSRLWTLRIGIPVAAMLFLALAIGLLQQRPVRGAPETIVVRFELQAPGAREVSVVGSWNRWDPEMQHLEDSDGDGVWIIEIPLRKGKEHQYQFLIDGENWIPDPTAPLQIDDGFGGINSVLQI
jgi:hypothetical protein